MNIGIYSGSFNPIHMGHLMLANYIVEFSDIDELWFLVTPHNPLKEDEVLLDEMDRLEMVKLALEDYPKLVASDFEFDLPRPSYTVNTLEKLSEKYPKHTFSLVIGADNWTVFTKWKDADSILANHHVYIYPRLSSRITIPKELKKSITVLDTPILEISSTFIRESVEEGKNVDAFLPEKVGQYIRTKNLYK